MKDDDGNITDMTDAVLQELPDNFCEKLFNGRDDYLNTRFTFHGTILNVVMVFLGLAIPMFCSFNFKGVINTCMGIGIVSGIVTAGMLIFAQRKLLRQKGEAVNKMLLSLFQKKVFGLFSGPEKGLEENSMRYWEWPFYLMSVSCIVAVITAMTRSF